MKRVIIAPHMKCNARCVHCCVSSHPHDERHLADDDVLRLVNEAVATPEVEVVSFTGGEALLRREFILNLISLVSAAGKATTLVSNGFWGITPQRASETLAQLRQAGLTVLTLSADLFHQPYVPLARVKNILEVAPGFPEIQLAINMCESKTNSADQVIETLGKAAEGVHITRFPITPVGAAAKLPDEEIVYRAVSTDDRLGCPGQVLLFSSDDRVYPCCSTGVMNSALSVGRASELSLQEAAGRIERNLIFRVISQEGFQWLVDRLKVAGAEKYQQSFPIVDSCHLCCEIFSDPENLQRLRPALEEYRQEYLANRTAG